MTQELCLQLQQLAEKYENPDFITNDPIQFIHKYSDSFSQEIAGFIAANLAFGRREQIIKHVKLILDQSDNNLKDFILNKKYKNVFPQNDSSFYRMFTNNSMLIFFDKLNQIIEEDGCLGEHYKKLYLNNTNVYLHQLIQKDFPDECNLIPHTVESSAKRINMFLRWMCRTESPVDLGLWDWYPKEKLLMPLDVHVLQEATNFGLISTTASGKIKQASLKTAVELTQVLKEAFPEDPVKGDFALFGLGISKSSH